MWSEDETMKLEQRTGGAFGGEMKKINRLPNKVEALFQKVE